MDTATILGRVISLGSGTRLREHGCQRGGLRTATTLGKMMPVKGVGRGNEALLLLTTAERFEAGKDKPLCKRLGGTFGVAWQNGTFGVWMGLSVNVRM